jgi:hypothetical protein
MGVNMDSRRAWFTDKRLLLLLIVGAVLIELVDIFF